MDQVYIGRQPIFDAGLRLRAYELLYRSCPGCNEARVEQPEQATAQVILNLFMEFGLEHLVGRHDAYVNLPRGFLVGDYPLPFAPRQVVLEVLEDVPVDQPLLEGLRRLRRQGFRVALDDFVLEPSRASLLELAEVVKLDLQALPEGELERQVQTLRRRGLTLLAEKIETPEEFERAKALGFQLFQGFWFARPHVLQRRTLSPNRLSVLRLLARLHDPKAGVGELAEAVSQDVAITYKLLRYLNSAFLGLGRPITSLHHAIVYLGIRNLRNWVTLIAFSTLEDKPAELLVTALVRAKLCELLAPGREDGSPETYFTAGLLSMLDVMMDQPLEELLAQLPLAPEIQAALLRGEGRLGQTLRCVLAYERGDWERLARELPGPSEGSEEQGRAGAEAEACPAQRLPELYLQAVAWADQAMAELNVRAAA
ncbi:MAG: HDOD domain-containing protein [Gammaproteobacteria bacterium]|nr:MAG: HDOD domain-containing protein [Gammaproteobacteria bacterium]